MYNRYLKTVCFQCVFIIKLLRGNTFQVVHIVDNTFLKTISKGCHHLSGHVLWNYCYLFLDCYIERLTRVCGRSPMCAKLKFKVTPQKIIIRREVQGTARLTNITRNMIILIITQNCFFNVTTTYARWACSHRRTEHPGRLVRFGQNKSLPMLSNETFHIARPERCDVLAVCNDFLRIARRVICHKRPARPRSRITRQNNV